MLTYRSCQPVHHNVILTHNLIIFQIFTGNRLVFGPTCAFVFSSIPPLIAYNRHFARLARAPKNCISFPVCVADYTAADGIVIPPYRAHHIIILILYGACLHRDACSIFLEVFRQSEMSTAPSGSVPVQVPYFPVYETVVGFCNHMERPS